MRKYSKVSPLLWTDHAGRVWRVPRSKGPLKFSKSVGYRALRSFVLKRDGHRCKRCGLRGVDPLKWDGSKPFLVADHIVSNRNGGSNHPDNLQALCDPCNARKSNTEDRGR